MAWPYPALGLPALGRLEVLDARLDTGFDLVVVVALLVDLGEQVGFFALEPGQQSGLQGTDLADLDISQEALLGGVQADRHFRYRHRRVLLLLHQLGNALTMLELLAGRFVQVRGKLGESGQLTVLGQCGTDTTGQLLDDLGLGRTTYPGHRHTSVDRGADTGVEQVGLQEDLTIGDGDHVGRNEGGYVTGLGFDDRQRGQGTGLALHFTLGELLDILFGYAGSALQQTAVQIEHVTGIGFTARRTAQQQGDLTVGHGLLGQVVEHDQRIFTAVAEELAHGATGIRSQELQGSRFGRRGGNDDGVGQGAMLFQLADDVGNGRLLLTDRYVDALDATVFLVDDRVDRHGGLTDLTVADDQLALATADRNHRVNRLVASLDRLIDRLTPDHARRHFLNGVGQF